MDKLIKDIIEKEIFFERANYMNPQAYDKQYANAKCQVENQEIKRLIHAYFSKDAPITDIGCGTGLGRALWDYDYLGIDKSYENIVYSRNAFPETNFQCVSAEVFVLEVEKVNPMFLFSLDYLSLGTIEALLEKTDKTFFAIRYNKPYLSRTSVYSGKKDIFTHFHPEYRRDALDSLLKDYGADSFELLGEEFYTVSVIQKTYT